MHLVTLEHKTLADLCRRVRLANPYAIESPAWQLWNDQCRWNVPILIEASFYLHEFCQTHQYRRILFTSRDGCLWIQVFRALFPEYESIYFHASRHAYLSGTASYIEYVQSFGEAVIVDANGRGATCELFFTTHLKKQPIYLAIVNCGDKHYGIVRKKVGSAAIEMLNYDTCGLLLDVQDGKPVRRPVEYPLEYIVPMHACVEECVRQLASFPRRPFDRRVIEWALQGIESGLAIERYITHQIIPPDFKSVSSFDLFDTLVGRFHYHPHSIFERVEALYPFPGFTFFRIAAACRSDHTLDGIYRELQKLIELTDEQASALKQFEFETELKHLFPIVENTQQVKDGDLIVTDTYYTKEQVAQLLRHVGIQAQVHIYASPHGKSSGAAWAFLKNNYLIKQHLGDSLHSDVNMARLQEIEASHYVNGELCAQEKQLFSLGQQELSYLCRAVRLSNPYATDSPESLLWNEQCAFNLPILLHSSLFLHEFCQTHQKQRILFTARDSCLWIQLFRQMFPDYDSIYFHSSRHAYGQATPSYVAYCESLYTDDTVIVDVQGKGTSAEKFFTAKLQRMPTYLAIVNCGDRHHAILRQDTSCEQIEMLNYDTCGTLIDVQNGVPVRRELEYDARYVEPMHACWKKCLEFLPLYTIDSFDAKIVDWAVASIREGLVLNRYLLLAYWHSEAYHDFMKSIQQVKDHLIFIPNHKTII